MKRLALMVLLAGSGSAFAEERPEAPSLAIGAGVQAPRNNLGLNIATVRFLFVRRLFLEPRVGFASTSRTDEIENTSGKFEVDTTSSSLLAGVGLRYAAASRGQVDLDALVEVGLENTRSEVDPEGNNNNVISRRSDVGLDWGIGLEWWVADHVSITGDALTPLVGVASFSTDDQAAETEVAGNLTRLGLQFDPTVRLQGHLHF